MTPELSRRLAKAVQSMDPVTQAVVTAAAEQAETFDDLPPDVQQLIELYEAL